MKNYISRPLYIRRIEPFIDKSIIKVITGQRRIGKSYILLQISDIIKKNIPEANIIFVDKEQLAFTEIRNYMDLYQYVLKKVTGHNHNYLFVDEIQEIEEFQLCLRSLLNENKCDIYCTGSNAKMLSSELATQLAGRYIEFPIHSLSYGEFLTFNQCQDSTESLKLYLTFGGMPYIHNLYMLPDDATVRREFGNLLEIADNYPKYVVTMDEMQSGGNYKGIKQISLRNFLLAEDKEKL